MLSFLSPRVSALIVAGGIAGCLGSGCDDARDERKNVAAPDAPRHAMALEIKGTADATTRVLVSVPDGWDDAHVAQRLTPPLSQIANTCARADRPDYALDVVGGKVTRVTTQVNEPADPCVVDAMANVVVDDRPDPVTGDLFVRWPAPAAP